MLRVWVLAVTTALCLSGLNARDVTTIFTQDEMKLCVRFRTPNLVQTATSIHVIARCCGANNCSDHAASNDVNR